MSGFLQEELLRQRRMEQMALEDRQIIQQLNQSPSTYQRDKKKSLARQYRDYMIYRCLEQPEEAAYGPRQEAADYIQFQLTQIRASHQGQDPTLEGGALKTGQCLLHLAASRLLSKDVGNDTLTRLADCLTAGGVWSGAGPDPSQEYYQTLHQEGNALLKEIYFRHLEAMDKKYGDKLCSMTPAAYLEALPEIEADFACVEDMQIFFQQIAPLGEQEALMGRKLDFYVQVWSRIKERTEILSDMQGEHVTHKGQLSGEYDDAYRRDMKALRTAAKRDKILRPRKKRPPLQQTLTLDQVRSQALAALTQQQLLEQEEQRKDNEIAEQFEQLTGQQARLQAYLTACSILKQDNPSPDDVEMAQATIRRFPGYTEERANQEIADLAGPINALSQQRAQGQEAPIDSPEMLLERCAQTTAIMQELSRQMRECSDLQLPQNYVDMEAKFNLASNRFQIIRNHPIYHSAVQARDAAKDAADQTLTQQQQEILAAVDQLTQTEALLRNFSPSIQARMSALARCGVAHRQDEQQREDFYLQHRDILSAYQSYQDEPIPLAKALEGPLLSPMALHLNSPDPVHYADLRRHLDRMKAVARFREDHPEYYRLGLSEKDYRKAQQMCDMLPYCQRLLDLTLRYYHISDRGGLTAGAICREFNQQVAQLQNVTRQWGGDSRNIPQELSQDLNRVALGIERVQQEIQADESLQGDESLQADLDMMGQLQGGVFLSTADHQTALRDFDKIRRVQQWSAMDEQGKQPDGPLSEEEQQAAAQLLQRFSDQYDRTLIPLIDSGCGDRALFEARAELETCAGMANFLNLMFQTPKGARLLELWKQDERFAPMNLQVAKLQTNFKTLSNLTGYATSLALTRALKNGVTSCNLQYNGRIFHAINTTYMKDMIAALREENLGGVEQLRLEGIKQLHKDEIEEIEMKKRVRMGVGRELEASRRKGKMVDVSGFVEWCGNRMGGLLQLLSWSIREKRTMQHGAVLYEQCKAKQDELLNLVPTMRDGHLPQQWQRGSAGITPPVQLDELYHDTMKADLLQDLRQSRAGLFAQQDPRTENRQALDLALEALERWCQVSGIVNTDVTEMEMSFLDVFMTNANAYIRSNESSGSTVLRDQCEKLEELLEQLEEGLRGTMGDTMTWDELELITASTTAYVEDTTFSANLDECNIDNVPLFLHTPNLNDVRQSSIGDCWLVSAISSIVRTDPEFIRSMFHDLGDGNVLVRLYAAVDSLGNAVTDKGKITEGGITMIPCWFKLRKQYETGWGNASDCTWVQLLEKAYALGGFNTQNEVEVREGRLYNVANELTMGDIWAGIAHMTGQIPKAIETDRAWSQSAPPPDVLCALTAGLPDVIANGLQKTLSATFEGETNPTLLAALSATLDLLKPQILEATFEERTKAGEEISQAEQTQYFMELQAHLLQNLELIRNGETPQGFEQRQQQMQRDDPCLIGTMDALDRKYCARYLCYEKNGAYSPETVGYFFTFQKIIEEGGTISISIPHCVNIIDAKQEGSRLFLLIRDPFNIYNTEYTRQEDGTEKAVSEGLYEVWSKHRENRFLVGTTQEEILRGGFRGTSWVDINQIVSHLSQSWSVNSKLLQPQDQG